MLDIKQIKYGDDNNIGYFTKRWAWFMMSKWQVSESWNKFEVKRKKNGQDEIKNICQVT